MGKTVTTEFANVFPGKTRHPHDPQRTPGGSSSGSAAAVSDCMGPLAIGTQTTGSTIRPASFCGIFGYRLTYGHLRCAWGKEAAGSFDTLGLMARSIADIALYRDVLLGDAPTPLPTAPGVPPRIGFCRTSLWSRLEPSTAQLLDNAATRLAQGGAKVQEVLLTRKRRPGTCCGALHLAERLCHCDNLVRPGTHPIVCRQVHPPHRARRIHHKLGRPGDVLSIDAGTRVHQVIAANHFCLWIRKKCISVSGFLTELARDLGRVYADRHRTNAHLCEFIEPMLNAPQLGVACRSLGTAVEHQ